MDKETQQPLHLGLTSKEPVNTSGIAGLSWQTIGIISGAVVGLIIIIVIVILLSGPSVKPPATLTATNITDAALTLNWPVVLEATEYVLQSKLKTATTYSDLTTTALLTYNVTSLLPNTFYNFQVGTKKGTTMSNTFTSIEILTLPFINTMSVTGTTDTSVSLSWDNEPNITSYTIETQTTIPGFLTSTTSNGFLTTTTVTNLTPNTSYEFRIKATNATGTGPFSLSYNRVTLPGTIASLSISIITSTGFQVAWAAVPNVTGYLLRYKLQSASTWSASIPLSSNNYAMTGLTAPEIYNVSVAAVNVTGPGQFNTGSTVTTILPPVGGATLTGQYAYWTRIHLSWTAVPGATSYYVYYKNDIDELYSMLSSSPATTRVLHGLYNNNTYSFKIRAENEAGVSMDYSNVYSATLVDPPAPVLSTTGSSGNLFVVSWAAIPGVESYDVSFHQGSSVKFHETTNALTSSYTAEDIGIFECKITAIIGSLTNSFSSISRTII